MLFDSENPGDKFLEEEGWWRPSEENKWHYIVNNSSLCGLYSPSRSPQNNYYRAGDDVHPGCCMLCQAKLTAHFGGYGVTSEMLWDELRKEDDAKAITREELKALSLAATEENGSPKKPSDHRLIVALPLSREAMAHSGLNRGDKIYLSSMTIRVEDASDLYEAWRNLRELLKKVF